MSVVFIISAPSGSGKSTLVERLMKHDPKLDFSISVTTRAPRPGEIPGKSYCFVSRERFLQLRDEGRLLEWAEVFGNFYGTTRDALDSARAEGRDLVLDIDVQGAAQLKKTLPEAVSIFILPPSRSELEKRLRKRSSDPDEVIQRRLREAAREVVRYQTYDYVLVNDCLEESFEQLRGVVLAERCRQSRAVDRIGEILKTFREDEYQ